MPWQCQPPHPLPALHLRWTTATRVVGEGWDGGGCTGHPGTGTHRAGTHGSTSRQRDADGSSAPLVKKHTESGEPEIPTDPPRPPPGIRPAARQGTPRVMFHEQGGIGENICTGRKSRDGALGRRLPVLSPALKMASAATGTQSTSGHGEPSRDRGGMVLNSWLAPPAPASRLYTWTRQREA